MLTLRNCLEHLSRLGVEAMTNSKSLFLPMSVTYKEATIVCLYEVSFYWTIEVILSAIPGGWLRPSSKLRHLRLTHLIGDTELRDIGIHYVLLFLCEGAIAGKISPGARGKELFVASLLSLRAV
jgi:hypothetical protein